MQARIRLEHAQRAMHMVGEDGDARSVSIACDRTDRAKALAGCAVNELAARAELLRRARGVLVRASGLSLTLREVKELELAVRGRNCQELSVDIEVGGLALALRERDPFLDHAVVVADLNCTSNGPEDRVVLGESHAAGRGLVGRDGHAHRVLDLEHLAVRSVPHREVSLGHRNAPNVDVAFLNEMAAVKPLEPDEVRIELDGHHRTGDLPVEHILT
mmetsp:Transcript_24780/g.57287  ORF Transcript_24780/g.57287 Transcript_24780/m.57287 type:complete len:217 (-) Transcript_24780:1519-2169(-)